MRDEELAVLKTIETDHRAFWMKDVEAWARGVHAAPHLHILGYLRGGGIIFRRGWEDVGQRSLEHIKALPAPQPELAAAPMVDPVIRVAAEMAWVSFERHYPYMRPSAWGPVGPVQELRILERHEGVWKIVLYGILDPYLAEEPAVRLSPGGQVVWKSPLAEKLLDEGDDFVVRGGKLRLRDRRADTRLQSAISWAGHLRSGLMPRQGAAPVVISTTPGRPRVSWVLAESGHVLVLLDDTRSSDEKIGHAAQVFGLSPVQERLSRAIVDGCSLPEFAASAGITPHTARTHLRRIFEKVGVNHQASLVRVLLSLTPPR